jgi:hypothetical protein
MNTQSYLIKCAVCKTSMVYVGNSDLVQKFIDRGQACRCYSKAQLTATPGDLK